MTEEARRRLWDEWQTLCFAIKTQGDILQNSFDFFDKEQVILDWTNGNRILMNQYRDLISRSEIYLRESE